MQGMVGLDLSICEDIGLKISHIDKIQPTAQLLLTSKN